MSGTLKCKSVQILSDHKTARTFRVSQERTNSRTNGLKQNKWAFPLDGGGRQGWVKLGREAKNTSKNTIEFEKEKIKERKKERKKWQFRSLKADEKLVLTSPFLVINNKAPRVLDAQIEYIP